MELYIIDFSFLRFSSYFISLFSFLSLLLFLYICFFLPKRGKDMFHSHRWKYHALRVNDNYV